MYIDFALSVKGKEKIGSKSIKLAPKSAMIVGENVKGQICLRHNSSRECSGCKKKEDS